MYEAYKDSGVEWLRRIPAHWDFMRLKTATVIRSEHAKYSEGAGHKFIGLENLVSYGSEVHETLTKYGDAIRAICRKGDVLFCKLRPYLAKVIIAPCDSFCTGELLVIKSFIGDMKYLRYVMLASGFLGKVNSQTQGATMPFAPPEAILNMYIPIPPTHEQIQIARYLDWKISSIDRLIAIRRKELADLQDYKKEIINMSVTQGDWPCVKIKKLFKIFSGATPDSYNPDFWDGNIIWITPADFQTKDKYIYHGARYITESGFKACSTYLVPSGSIIFTKRAPVGKVAISRAELCTNQGCLSCVPLEGVVPEYFFYVMSIYTGEFESLSAGATFKEISLSTFRNIPLPCPPTHEQIRIANHLDNVCSHIDNLITNYNAQIITLKQLKSAIISETVTGRHDVRGIKIP